MKEFLMVSLFSIFAGSALVHAGTITKWEFLGNALSKEECKEKTEKAGYVYWALGGYEGGIKYTNVCLAANSASFPNNSAIVIRRWQHLGHALTMGQCMGMATEQDYRFWQFGGYAAGVSFPNCLGSNGEKKYNVEEP